ncbi:MAG: hypothetical protein J7527_11270 [Chitinophagaceae bacterium]|nr:hypothetical protein [Chitinophagaceae bacterium]
MKAILFIKAVLFTQLCYTQTTRITFKAPLFYPEGIAVNATSGDFYTGSVKTGTIIKVSPQGAVAPFYSDTSLKSSFGMKVDAKRSKLWVCTGDPNYSDYKDSSTYKKMIRLIGIDLSNGKKTDDIDLSNLYPGKHFANDLTLDDRGNIYVTDSYSPVVYKVDASGKASVLTQSDWFKSIDLGLNGIVWHKNNYLLVAHSDGHLYKIDLSDPARITRVQHDSFFSGADGLLFDGEGSLILVQNKGTHKIFRLHSTDNWQSAKVVAATAATDRFIQPSTAVQRGSQIYVVNSKLNELNDPTAIPSKEFSFQEVRFLPMK